MSFYNVTTPTTFNVVSDKRFMLTQQSKMDRTSATLQFTGAKTFTPEQLIAGVVYVMNDSANTGTGNINYTLPSATDLITLLMGPGGFDVSNNDIFSLRVVNKRPTSGDTVTIVAGTGGTGTSVVVPVSSDVNVHMQIGVVVSGSGTTYSYTIF